MMIAISSISSVLNVFLTTTSGHFALTISSASSCVSVYYNGHGSKAEYKRAAGNTWGWFARDWIDIRTTDLVRLLFPHPYWGSTKRVSAAYACRLMNRPTESRAWSHTTCVYPSSRLTFFYTRCSENCNWALGRINQLSKRYHIFNRKRY